jgi:hypothetical protein
MTKIVINKCFGGFGLSVPAFKHYLNLKGIKYGTRKSQFQWREDDQDFYHDGHVGEPDHYISDRDIARDDPALIQTIEELGDEASDRFARLRIIEIPDGVEWQIEEYDGNEWVAEQHRTWR